MEKLGELFNEVDLQSNKKYEILLSPTLLLLGLPWLTGTGDFLSRG